MVSEKKVDYNKLLEIGRDLLVAIGENPEREGLVETPKRFAKHWRDFIEFDAGKIDTTFGSVTTNQMVVVSGMRVWSLCEHHLLPFWCDVTIGYIAQDKVIGLSKLARIAHKHSHSLQVQERLVDQIANEISEIIGCDNVAVYAKGVHTCMVMRGIKTDGVMSSSVMRGAFYNDEKARSEFFYLAKE